MVLQLTEKSWNDWDYRPFLCTTFLKQRERRLLTYSSQMKERSCIKSVLTSGCRLTSGCPTMHHGAPCASMHAVLLRTGPGTPRAAHHQHSGTGLQASAACLLLTLPILTWARGVSSRLCVSLLPAYTPTLLAAVSCYICQLSFKALKTKQQISL